MNSAGFPSHSAHPLCSAKMARGVSSLDADDLQQHQAVMSNPTVPSSPPPSPQSPALFHLPALSRILLWNARRREQAVPENGTATLAANSDPPKNDVKPYHIVCSSGSELKTHGRLVDGRPDCRKTDVITHQDVFVCLNGVDTLRLLVLARRRVFAKVELLGGNAIIDERYLAYLFATLSEVWLSLNL